MEFFHDNLLIDCYYNEFWLVESKFNRLFLKLNEEQGRVKTPHPATLTTMECETFSVLKIIKYSNRMI